MKRIFSQIKSENQLLQDLFEQPKSLIQEVSQQIYFDNCSNVSGLQFSNKTSESCSIVQNRFLQFYDFVTFHLPGTIEIAKFKQMLAIKIDYIPHDGEILEIFQRVQKKINSNTYQKKNWSHEELIIFLFIVAKYTELKQIELKFLQKEDWTNICQIFPGKTIEQCQEKWQTMQKNYLFNQPWQREEDELLFQIIQEKGTKKWTEISKELNQKSNLETYRVGKQCRERWNNHLNPSLKKDPWTLSEDIVLLQQSLKFGKKWSVISKKIPGRTENSVKNRFNSLLKNKYQSFPTMSSKNDQKDNSSTTNSCHSGVSLNQDFQNNSMEQYLIQRLIESKSNEFRKQNNPKSLQSYESKSENLLQGVKQKLVYTPVIKIDDSGKFGQK